MLRDYPPDLLDQLGEVLWAMIFTDVSVHPGAYRIQDRLLASPTRVQDEGNILDLLDYLDKLNAVNSRHRIVGQNAVVWLTLDRLQDLLRVGEGVHEELGVVILYEELHQLQLVWLVVQSQHIQWILHSNYHPLYFILFFPYYIKDNGYCFIYTIIT